MVKFYSIILIISGCANVSNIGAIEEACIGKKNNEHICYYGQNINKSECLDYGYGQNKGSVQFLYLTKTNCSEFCDQIYDSGFECSIINLDE